MTTPGSYADVSSPVTAPPPVPSSPARQFTEPLRELTVLALLAGNGVFLFLGFSGLFFVLDGWATGFTARCAAVFPTFVGPLSLGLPIVAMLLATHVQPMLRRTRIWLMVVLAELAVSAVFGAITFLGAFADGLSSVRATLEGTLWRFVWLGFLVLACIVTVRLWMGLFPPPKPRPAGYGPYAQPSYGRPYPGQPSYPNQQPQQQQPPQSYQVPSQAPPATFAPGTATPPYPGAPAQTLFEPGQALTGPTASGGWPLVPPPPMPGPLVVDQYPVPQEPVAGQPVTAVPMSPHAAALYSESSDVAGRNYSDATVRVPQSAETIVVDPADLAQPAADEPADEPGDDQPLVGQASDEAPSDGAIRVAPATVETTGDLTQKVDPPQSPR